MTSRIPKFPLPRGTRLEDQEGELQAVRDFLYQLRHNRGRWPKNWVKGMLRHYEGREASLRESVSRLKRGRKK